MSPSEYFQSDAIQLQQLIEKAEANPLEIYELAVAICEKRNPALNAIITPLFTLGRQMATSVDPKSPFAGVPFGIKDLGISVGGTPWHIGAEGYRDLKSEQDSFLAQKFRAAGLLFLGKTNTPEFGYTPFTEPSAYGVTHNPWKHGYSPGGSSGGSAAAVAAGILPLATASDGGGSIRIPASCCGLIGLKPSRGRISQGPQFGDSWLGAIVEGCVSRSVRDSARYLDVFAGGEPGDPYWAPTPEIPYEKVITQKCPPLRIGYSVTHTTGGVVDPQCIEAVEKIATTLTELGHEVTEVPLPYQADDLLDTFFALTIGEGWADVKQLEDYLGRPIRRGDVEDNTLALYLLGKNFPAGEFAMARRNWNLISRRVASIYRSHRQTEGIDLLLTPTVSRPPFPIGAIQLSGLEKRLLAIGNTTGLTRFFREKTREIAGEIFDFIPWTPLSNMTGQPSISLPTHRTPNGLPVGVMFTADLYREDLLFGLAAQLEKAGKLQAHEVAPFNN